MSRITTSKEACHISDLYSNNNDWVAIYYDSIKNKPLHETIPNEIDPKFSILEKGIKAYTEVVKKLNLLKMISFLMSLPPLKRIVLSTTHC